MACDRQGIDGRMDSDEMLLRPPIADDRRIIMNIDHIDVEYDKCMHYKQMNEWTSLSSSFYLLENNRTNVYRKCVTLTKQDSLTNRIVFTARCTLVQSAVLRSHVVSLSVSLSVCDVGEL